MPAGPISSNEVTPDRAATVSRFMRDWLGFAAGLAGLAVALASALGPWRETGAGAAPADAIATVDGRAISRATYDRAIAALEADKRNPVSDADRRTALATLIDEELLVRRGLDLGLADVEPTVRKALVDAMVLLASVPSTGAEPSEAELRAYYDGRPAMFGGGASLTISTASLPAEAKDRAERLASLLRSGVSFEKAAAETGARVEGSLPPRSSQRKLADYVGPTLAAAAGKLEPGEAAGPFEAAGRLLFVLLHERREGDRPAFESVRTEVLEAWRRTSRDRALEDYLARLRARASVTRAKDAPR